MRFPISLCLAPLLGLLPAQMARAADGDTRFFQSVEGQWTGPGEIVAGKYKGTKFICTFTGSAPGSGLGIVLDGGCRVGPFNQAMRATIERDGRSYRGKFQDGAGGKGLDLSAGNVVEGRKMVMAIARAQLKGAMLTRLADDNTMNVTVSVNVEKELVPVIGMSLKRVDGAAVGSVSGNRSEGEVRLRCQCGTPPSALPGISPTRREIGCHYGFRHSPILQKNRQG